MLSVLINFRSYLISHCCGRILCILCFKVKFFGGGKEQRMKGNFLLTFYMASFLSLCSCNRLIRYWWRRDSRNSRDSVLQMTSQESSSEMTSRLFDCTQTLIKPIEYFELNVTLNTSAVLEMVDGAELIESSSDGSWHYLRSIYDSYEVGDLQVQFTLSSNDTPGGYCLFLFKDEITDSTLFPNITTMTSCYETMAQSVGLQETNNFTTPRINYVSNHTTVNNSYPESKNGSKCLCPCECATPLSKEKSDIMMAAILDDLRIPKYSTSYSKRKLSSAPDYRISCTGIGLVGIFVMVAVFGIILIGDLNLFLFNARTAISHIRGHYGL